MAGSTVSEIQGANNMVDRISQLPNEVLVDILSLLTFNEVGRSSVLSKRWRDLWKMTGRLNFGSGKQYVLDLDRRCNDPRVLKRRTDQMRSKVRAWVNRVVRLHECPSIEEFSVKFDLDTSATQDIDEWIKFMIRKRVKTVDLDFSGFRVQGIYTISKECCDYITSVSNMNNLKNLRSIRLNYVNIDGQLVEYLLSNCPYLEVLSVIYSDTLSDLKVVGSSLSLKYLECHSCRIVRSIEIEAPKLEKFVYCGRIVKFYIGSNPRLTELDLGGALGEDVTYALVPFGSLLWQLEALTLRMHLDYRFCKDLPSFGELSNLKHLMLDFKLNCDIILYKFTGLIAAAPVLAKFILMSRSPYRTSKRHHIKTLVMQPPHQCLKEAKILGYQGGHVDIEMAEFVLTNAVNLENLVIDPFHPGASCRADLPKRLAAIDKDVKDLKEMFPLSAQLIVVDM